MRFLHCFHFRTFIVSVVKIHFLNQNPQQKKKSMSLSQIAIVGAAVALLAPSAVQACGCPYITGRDLKILAGVALLTSPIWIVPATIYGICVGVQAAATGVQDAVAPKHNSSLTWSGVRD